MHFSFHIVPLLFAAIAFTRSASFLTPQTAYDESLARLLLNLAAAAYALSPDECLQRLLSKNIL
jgi:hypothetical protein